MFLCSVLLWIQLDFPLAKAPLLLPPSLLLLLTRAGPVVPLPSDWLLITALLAQSSTDGRFARLNSTLAALQALFGSSSSSSAPSSSQRSVEKADLSVELLLEFFAFFSFSSFLVVKFFLFLSVNINMSNQSIQHFSCPASLLTLW